MHKLKILLVSRNPWGDSLGVSKVHFDLKHEYEKLGHQVDYLSWDVLYPDGQSTYDSIMGPLFTKKIFQYLKANAYKYDVIDANCECVPYSKASFNFFGVLVFRSHGLPQTYQENLQSPVFKKILEKTQKKVRLKTRIGNLYRSLHREVGIKELNGSIDHADLVHCLNQAEYDFLVHYGIAKEDIKHIPNGLADSYILQASKLPVEYKENTLSFIGSWTFRKGITDLDEILNVTQAQAEVKLLNLIGGHVEAAKVESYFSTANKSLLKIIPRFTQESLLSLICDVKVGVFPSYVEGLPLSIVEQLACGIPVVAYKVPGSIEILQKVDSDLLIESGNTKEFGKKVAEILNMADNDYTILSLRCKEVARDFTISKVAAEFIKEYQNKLN